LFTGPPLRLHFAEQHRKAWSQKWAGVELSYSVAEGTGPLAIFVEVAMAGQVV